MTRVRKVIVSDEKLTGKGVEGDPVRRVFQVWTTDGELLAEVDTNEEQRGYIVNNWLKVLGER